MAWAVRFHDGANEEFLNSVSYYDERRRGLGEAFVGEVEKATGLLRLHPKLGAPVRGGFRMLVVNRFPFVIIYRANPDGLYVIAVAHTSRRPGYWRSRL